MILEEGAYYIVDTLLYAFAGVVSSHEEPKVTKSKVWSLGQNPSHCGRIEMNIHFQLVVQERSPDHLA